MSSRILSFRCRTYTTGGPAGISPAASGVTRYRFAIGRMTWSTRKRSYPSSGEACDIDPPLARAVELAEEDALVPTKGQLPVAERHEHLRAHQRRAHVGRRIGTIGIVDVLPFPVLVDHLLQRAFE